MEHCSQNETGLCCTKHWLANSRAGTQEFRIVAISCSHQCWPAKSEILDVLKLAMHITQICDIRDLLWQRHFTLTSLSLSVFVCVFEFVLCHNIHYFKRRYSRSSCHCGLSNDRFFAELEFDIAISTFPIHELLAAFLLLALDLRLLCSLEHAHDQVQQFAIPDPTNEVRLLTVVVYYFRIEEIQTCGHHLVW